MGVEENIDVVRRLEAAYGAKDYDTVRALVSPAFAANTPGSDVMPAGVEGAIAANEGGHSFYPDRRTEIEDIFGEDDKVVAHIRMTGTNSGIGVTWLGVRPDGRAIDVDWIQISRHDEEGRILETWAQMDVAKLMMQLGAMPGSAGP